MKKYLFFLIVILFITSAFIQTADAHRQSSLLEKTRKSKLIILAKCIGTEPNNFFVADYKIIEVWKGDYFEKTIRIDYKKSYKKEFPPEPSPIKDEQVVLFLKDDLTLLSGFEGKLNIGDNNVPLYMEAVKKFLKLDTLADREKVLAIIKMMDDKNSHVKENMLRELHNVDNTTYALEIADLLKHKDVSVRQRAISALEHTQNKQVLENVIGALKDSDSKVRREAVTVLWRMGDDKRITSSLIEAFDDESPDVRSNVIFSLSMRNNKDATYLYYKAMEDKDPLVRSAGINAFEWLNDPKATPKLLIALKDDNYKVRASAVRTLYIYIRVKVVEPKSEIVKLVEPLLNDSNGQVRKEAKQFFFEVDSIENLK